jgi:hypothetical protein
MKINMPVTNTEHMFEDTDSIVSKTDAKGIITYVNEDFNTHQRIFQGRADGR